MPTLTQLFEAAMIEGDCLPNTRRQYHHYVGRFYRFTRKPASQWTGADVRLWLIELHRLNYSRSSRKTALCAVKFVFDRVLKAEMGWLDLPPMPAQRRTVKIIPTREEIGRIFAGLRGQARLMAAIMYGGGLRVDECCKLRVQDIDLATPRIDVLNGKGDKVRSTVLPVLLIPALRRQIEWRRAVHANDVAAGGGLVELPGRLAVKYKSAARDLRWQWLFPSAVTRGQYRWHITSKPVQDQMRAAVAAAGVLKRVTPHTLRHAFVTHGLEIGNDVRVMQDLCGHEDVNTTMGYNQAPLLGAASPLDAGPRVRTAPPAFALSENFST